MSFLGHVVRFIVSALVLMVVGFLVPQFSVGGFWSALFPSPCHRCTWLDH